MRKLTYSFPAKVAAVFFLVFSAVGCGIFGCVIAVALSTSFYEVSAAGAQSFSAALYELLDRQVIGEYGYAYMSEHGALFSFIFQSRYAAILLCLTFFVLLIVLFIFLLCAAGRREGVDGVYLGFFDRIPLDLSLAAAVFGELLCVGFFFEISYYLSDITAVPLAVLDMIAMLLIAVAFFYTFAARVKAGKWWKNTVIGLICGLLWRFVSDVFGWMGQLARAIPLVWKVSLGAGAYLLLLFYIALIGGFYDGEFAVLFLIVAFIGFAVCVLGAAQMKRLWDAGERLAVGNIDYKVDTKHLFFDFRRHAENLNSIGEGMSAVVEQRMRSERLKTELITNVSHDIKTPLTSIVNYVDLLQKPHTSEEESEYLAVLARQSDRLRRLTVDLVEASKASTGNLPVELIPTNTEELIHQAVAEYGEKFAGGGLTPIITMPEKPISVLADGRHLWRVLDNLFANAVKYAQPGTRVYIDVRRMDGGAVISVKNISRDRLNVSPDELMERFVRGDTSRHTEGSGLGLSIARSLTELMGGVFRVIIDGDLFKAEIRLRLS